MVLNEKTNNKNKNISATVKYLGENRFNVRITGVCEGIDVTFQDVKSHQQGENDIQLDISGHSIFKAKYYSTQDGNIRVLKKDGSVTNIVIKFFDNFRILFKKTLESLMIMMSPAQVVSNLPCLVVSLKSLLRKVKKSKKGII